MFARIFCSPAGPARWFWQLSVASSGGSRVHSGRRHVAGFCAGVIAAITCAAIAAENTYPLEVLPPECQRMTDPKTGAELLFLTTAPENDANLYFHEYSWLAESTGLSCSPVCAPRAA